MNQITLEQARYYRHLVPWELDERDLKIINSHRIKTEVGSVDEIKLTEALWKGATV
jgi:hypothetical protein